MQLNRVVRQSGWSILSCDFASQPRPHRAIDVPNRKCGRNGLTFLQCRTAEIDQRLSIERAFQVMMLNRLTVATGGRRNIGLKKQLRQVELTRFPVIDLSRLQALRLAHHLVQTTKSKLGHQLTYLL